MEVRMRYIQEATLKELTHHSNREISEKATELLEFIQKKPSNELRCPACNLVLTQQVAETHLGWGEFYVCPEAGHFFFRLTPLW